MKYLFVLSLLWAFVVNCTSPAERANEMTTRSCAPLVVRVEVRVPCMDAPPKPDLPTWPTPDRLGNMVMHASTADMIRDALDSELAYVNVQYARCAQVAGRTWSVDEDRSAP